jgi:cell division protein FtsB
VVFRIGVWVLICAACAGVALAQGETQGESEEEFGPVVRAYLGYLRNEQEVVDDRASRHEVSAAYYRRNSNRIRALREIAIRIARETGNDYLPELEASARDEMHNLFEHPPRPSTLRVGAILNNTFRYLGSVRAGETFYIFARLDPYEQAELIQKQTAQPVAAEPPPADSSGHQATGRPRRVGTP